MSSRGTDGSKTLQTVGLVVLGVVAIVLAAYSLRSTPPPTNAGSSASIVATPTEAPKLNTVFMGDSITQMSTASFDDESSPDSWVRYVVDRDDTPWIQTANVGKGGEVTDLMVKRFRDDVLAQEPDAVVLLAGANDAAGGIDTDVTLANLRKMVELARGAKAKVWMVSPPPNSNNVESIAVLVDAEKELAKELDVPFADTYHAISDDGRWPEGYSVDGTHPSVKGAKAIARVVRREFF